MTQMCVVRIIERKHLLERQWKHPVSCRVDFSCWHTLTHVHLSLQVSCTCSTIKPTQHVHLSLGVSCTCLIFRSGMFSPVGLSRTCHYSMTVSVRGSSNSDRQLIDTHGFMFHVCIQHDYSLSLTFAFSSV